MPAVLTSQATASALWYHMGDWRPRTVRVRDLQHYYGEGELRKQVLFDNELDVFQGEIVVMTGPSGSGKTTLLTLIGTLRAAQEGSLKVLNRELLGASPQELVQTRRDIGFIFQAHNLFESLTAMQNVKMGMELFDFSESEMKERATELLTRLGLGERLDYKPKSLSGGQKQRVAIARGLAHRPKIVLADEPTAALDKQSGREVVTLFRELADEHGVTIVMVTHDNRILDVADRIVNMVDGRIASSVNVQEATETCRFLQELPMFSQLTPNTLASVADKMIPQAHTKGEVIIRQGDDPDKFYLIRAGEVDVFVESDGDRRKVASLGAGDHFGESSLLSGKSRNATVVAKDRTVLYSLSAEDFNAAVESSSSLRDELLKSLFERQ